MITLLIVLVAYLALGLMWLRVLAELAPGGGANNWAWPRNREDGWFFLGVVVGWPLILGWFLWVHFR